MWKFKGCPRCGGDIYLDQDESSWYEHCLQCGYTCELKSIAEFEEQKATREKIPVLATKRKTLE